MALEVGQLYKPPLLPWNIFCAFGLLWEMEVDKGEWAEMEVDRMGEGQASESAY